jgi:hypothetical protein
MTAYTGIQGQNILIVSSDPANPIEGQIWYNTTSNTLKAYLNTGTGVWTSAANMPYSVGDLGGAGITSAALAFGGDANGGPAPAGLGTTNTVSFNGTAWTSVAASNIGRWAFASGGSQTAAWQATGDRGNPTPIALVNSSESWNGSSWTTQGNVNTQRDSVEGIGISTAGLMAGGKNGPTYYANTELFNGSSWTNGPNLTSALQQVSIFGTQTACVGVGGIISPGTRVSTTQNYNGTTWTNSPASYPTGAQGFNSFGSQTSGVASGGYNPPTYYTTSNTWNGSAWTAASSLLNQSFLGASTKFAADGSTGLNMAGYNSTPGYTAAVQQWTYLSIATKTITTS